MIDAPALSEAELVVAYGQPVVPVRTEPCACGGVIIAPDLAAMIVAAVFVHNQSTGHVDWCHRSGTREYAIRSNRRQAQP